MRSKQIVLWLLFFLLIPGIILPDIPAVEREALIALYNATGGDNWERNDNWKTGGVFSPPGTENTWWGITCDAANTMVIEIHLESKNLQGTLPPEIGNFTNLEYLDLPGNLLSGFIPAEIGNLTHLQFLRLYSNQLSGSIPPEIGDCISLKVMQIHGNQLTGPIPAEMGNLSSATTI